MVILTHKDFEGTAEVDVARGICHGKLLFINDLITYESDTPGDLQNQFELAVEDYLETCHQLGREAQRPFRGQFNVRIPPELHHEATRRAVIDGVRLNEVMVRALGFYLHGKTEVTNHLHVMVGSPKQLKIEATTSQPMTTPMTFQKGVARGN